MLICGKERVLPILLRWPYTKPGQEPGQDERAKFRKPSKAHFIRICSRKNESRIIRVVPIGDDPP